MLESRFRSALFLCFFKVQLNQNCGIFVELSTHYKGKMEAKMEVSLLELYYTEKGSFR